MRTRSLRGCTRLQLERRGDRRHRRRGVSLDVVRSADAEQASQCDYTCVLALALSSRSGAPMRCLALRSLSEYFNRQGSCHPDGAQSDQEHSSGGAVFDDADLRVQVWMQMIRESLEGGIE